MTYIRLYNYLNKLNQMKKVALFSLFAFVLGSFTFASTSINPVSVSIELSLDDECDKCGKKDCEGKCTAEKKACTKGKKGCCKKKAAASASTSVTGEAGVSAEMEKTAYAPKKKACCKSKSSCSKAKAKTE